MQVTGRSLNDIYTINNFPLSFVDWAKAQDGFND